MRVFKTLDTNHDGVIDGFEIADYEQKVAPELLPTIARLTARDIPPLPDETRGREARGEGQGQRAEIRRRVGMPNGGAAFSLTGEQEPIAADDADLDGKVTLAEAIAAARRRFAMLDARHDGRLTLAELPLTAAQRLVAKADRKSGGHGGRPKRH